MEREDQCSSRVDRISVAAYSLCIVPVMMKRLGTIFSDLHESDPLESERAKMDASRLLTALNMMGLESDDGVNFRPMGEVPMDLRSRFPQLVQSSLSLGDEFLFLDNFLIDARAFWTNGQGETLSSGPWMEQGETGQKSLLEATVLRGERPRILLLAFLGDQGEGLHAVLQTARERSLSLEHLARAQTRLQESEDRYRGLAKELEHRVSRRTEELSLANEELRNEIEERLKTNRKLLAYQEQLRSLTDQLIFAEKRERCRLAAELHDEIGQLLAAVQMRLGVLSSGEGQGIARDLQDVRSSIKGAIDATRSLVFELGSPALFDLGLTDALRSLVDRVSGATGLSIKYENLGETPFMGENMQVVLFQSVRELLHNVRKHAKATEVLVSIGPAGESLEVVVEDDGVGFDADRMEFQVSKDGGFGLFNVRERLDHLGGSFRLDSRVGGGTRVTLRTPASSDHRPESSEIE